ncbi:conserved hypothetical protein [Sphingorhabdus sp. 109]|jgi:hypothetical protein|nr:conserved hypothetical protein [Sphingorhabdus sp. 109]
MDSLMLLLLLAAPPDRSPAQPVSGPTRVQAVASVRILRADVIDFDTAVDRRGVQHLGADDIFRLPPTRSAGTVKSDDGRIVSLQEFH